MIRSLLYVPASSERFVAKAHERGADAIVLDLEDAVAPAEKPRARAALSDAVPAVGRNGATVFVRTNSEPALQFADAEAACRAGAFGLFVAKTKGPQDLARLAAHLNPIEHAMGRPPLRFMAVVEDPGAVLDARAIATATPRVLGLLAGGEDLATAMNAEPTPEVLRLPKLLVHLAAKAASVGSYGLIRSVADFADTEAITHAAEEARTFGFDGATCVHPNVVPILNRAFAPSTTEVERARRLIDAAATETAAGRGAFLFEGVMVDEPIVTRARALVARAQSGASRSA